MDKVKGAVERKGVRTYVIKGYVDCNSLEKIDWAIDMIRLILRIVGMPMSVYYVEAEEPGE